jgi:hypothetical protein
MKSLFSVAFVQCHDTPGVTSRNVNTMAYVIHLRKKYPSSN